MKRIFESEKAVDLLINEYTKATGVKIAKAINNAIYYWFLPTTSVLHVESNFILQQELHGRTDNWVTKQSLSRGITWLGNYPIENPNVLKNIILRFNRSPVSRGEDTRSDYVIELYEYVENKIKESKPDYKSFFYQNFPLDVLENWDIVWQDKKTYDLLSTVVFCEEPFQPFTWYECISFLKDFEILADEKYGLK